MTVGFHALRITALFLHFVLTTALYWTKFQSVNVTLKPNYSNDEYLRKEASYETVISLGIILLSLQGAMLFFDQGKLRLKDVFGIASDLAAVFFILWIILDGLGWDTYIYIFSFCVVIPWTCSTAQYAPYLWYYVQRISRVAIYRTWKFFDYTGDWCGYWYRRWCE